MSKLKDNAVPSGWSIHLRRGLFEALVISLLILSGFVLLAEITYYPKDPGWSYMGEVSVVRNGGGRAGAFCADLLFMLFGYLAYLFPMLIAYWGIKVLRERHSGLGGSWPMFSVRLVGFVLTMLAGTGLSHMHFSGNGSFLPEDAGGVLGRIVGGAALDGFNPFGGTMMLVALFLIGVTIFTDLSWISLAEKLGAFAANVIAKAPVWWKELRAKREDKRETRQVAEKRRQVFVEAKKKQDSRKPPTITQPPKVVEKSERLQKEKQQTLFVSQISGTVPPLSLLDAADENTRGGFSEEALNGMSRLLELKLKDFNVEAEVVAVQPGPHQHSWIRLLRWSH